MAHSIPISHDVGAKRIGLMVWMERVLLKAEEARHGWNADAVHDLRVALRRCRTMAEALSEVNPGPGWRKLKKSSRALFHNLGVLRDTQVKKEWVKKLGTPGDPIRKNLLRALSLEERKHRKAAEQALDKFDRKDWRRWSKKLPPKAQFFPLESVVFQRLALTSLNESVELYRRARKGRSRVAWHRLRIGLKRFRYIVENFLPQRYEAWGEDLTQLQDLLGDVHDLDVLRTEIRRRYAGPEPVAAAAWLERIETDRKARLELLRTKTNDKEFLWLAWRGGLQGGNTIQAVSLIDVQNTYSAS
ncbi:MAG TPA: CHAD domain-containing protein [Candidatus Limnocylindria bacterium]|nr:CHAD domain-containing protein [Candidatus Limnocylindria bacterium]